MHDLIEFDVIQDTPDGQDGVYFETQAQLGLASEENIAKYHSDHHLRQRLLPPYLRGQTPELGGPILIFLWAPFEATKRRILEARGRSFESQVPDGYLRALYENTVQWMFAMQQAGVPTIIIDAQIDFRAWMNDRRPVIRKTWEKIGEASSRPGKKD